MNTNEANNTSNNTSSAKLICKLGLDCHAGSIMMARQVEGLNPQPPQKFTVPKFLAWAQEQLKKGYEIHSCYEAGPTGYVLHRRLEAMGIKNLVVCPTRLDSRGKGVNTDKTDATELVVRLDRYVAGNKKAFAVVVVPTPEQEQRRAVTRQRDQLRKKRQSIAAQGRTLLLNQGYRYSNNWWKTSSWSKLKEEVPAWIIEALECFRRVIECMNQEVLRLSAAIKEQAPKELPKGVGALTHEVIEREIRDWGRFKTARKLGSYSGLTGGVSGSGETSSDLSITKSGNRRLRASLVECSWRMLMHQPDYWLVKKWAPVLLKTGVHARRRKKAIVAFARQLLIDLWQWKLGRTTPEKLGWQMV